MGYNGKNLGIILPRLFRGASSSKFWSKNRPFFGRVKLHFPPWYDADYVGGFLEGYLVILRKVTFRPKPPPHECYPAKGKVQKYLIFFLPDFSGRISRRWNSWDFETTKSTVFCPQLLKYLHTPLNPWGTWSITVPGRAQIPTHYISILPRGMILFYTNKNLQSFEEPRPQLSTNYHIKWAPGGVQW